jgi:hypothetical protein
MSDKLHTMLRASGYAIAVGVEGGRRWERDTCRCVHCGCHWYVERGSRRIRGFCQRCDGPTCGPGCIVGLNCVPHELLLDNMEKGRPLDWTPVQVLVPAAAWAPIEVALPSA